MVLQGPTGKVPRNRWPVWGATVIRPFGILPQNPNPAFMGYSVTAAAALFEALAAPGPPATVPDGSLPLRSLQPRFNTVRLVDRAAFTHEMGSVPAQRSKLKEDKMTCPRRWEIATLIHF